MAWDLIPTVIGSGTLLICGLLALHAGVQLINIALIYSAAHVLMFIAGLVIVIKRFTKLNIKIEFIFWKSLLLTSIPFAINGFLVPIYHRIDIVMISFLKDEAAVGLYNAANVLAVSPFIILGYGFSHALFPSFTYYFTNDRQIFNSIVEKAFKYSTSLLIPIGAGVTLLASQFVQIIYGPQFIQSVDAMKLLIWTGIILFLNILYINIMEATGKQKYATAILGTGAVSNVILNYILIPPFGINGAAVATIVTQAICLIFAHYVTRRDLSYKIIVGVAIRPIIASALMSIFIIYFPEINIILTIFLAIIIYFIVLYLLRGINKSDITFFKELKQ
jgi:O-antigen/teichoic acid export membrane protein